MSRNEAVRQEIYGFSQIETQILTAIAMYAPFSLQEVGEAYKILGSYDKTLAATEMAREAFTSLCVVVENMAVRSNE